MKIDREINGDVAVLSLRGEFDSFVVNSFLEEIESLAANGVNSIVLDMRTVKFIMSTAIGAIVKSRKMMKELGGDLVISQPSEFVRDVLDSLGLTKVIKVFDENRAAVENLGLDGVTNLPSGNSVLFHFVDADLQAAVGRPVIGRIIELKEEGVRAQVAQAPGLFPAGAEMRAKFRLPLFKRAYYFEIPSNITGAAPNDSGSELRVSFTGIEEEDRESIRQFLNDMNFLRDEAKNAGDD